MPFAIEAHSILSLSTLSLFAKCKNHPLFIPSHNGDLIEHLCASLAYLFLSLLCFRLFLLASKMFLGDQPGMLGLGIAKSLLVRINMELWLLLSLGLNVKPEVQSDCGGDGSICQTLG